MKTILFVCTGNTCRSPMAEGIAQRWIDDQRVEESVLVGSAGVAASEGATTSPETVAALRALGIDYQGRSKPLTAEMIRSADFVICMTQSHFETARLLVNGSPADAEKIHRLDPAGDIEDPIGMGQEAYDQLAAHLTELIPARLEELMS